MSDLTITIDVPPTSAVSGAKQVTAAVRETEISGASANRTFKQLAQEGLAAVGFQGKALAGSFKEMSKNLAMEQLRQGLAKVNTELTEMGLSLGLNGAAIGFQLAGPLGAAAGAAGELIGTGLGNWLSASDRAARDAATGYLTAAWQMDAFAAGVEKAELAHASLVRRLNEENPLIGGMNRILAETTVAFDDARNKVMAYDAALVALQAGKMRTLASGGTPFTTVDDVKVQRGLRDAQLELTASTTIYGSVLTEIVGKENHRRDAMADAKAALDAGAISQRQYNEFMRQFAVHAGAATEAVQRYGASIFALDNVKPGSNAAAWKAEEAARRRIVDLEIERDAMFRDQLSPAKEDGGIFGGDWAAETQKMLSEGGSIEEAFADASRGVVAYQSAIDDLSQKSMKSLEAAAQSAGAMLVDAFMDGEFSAEKFFDSLARQLAGAAVSNLIGTAFGPGNLLGGGATGFDSLVGGGRGAFLPGFASGGDMLVGGAGGTDSRIAAFRVTPGESIHVRTPQQRDASMAASRGGGVKIVNQSQSMRSLLQDFDGDGEFDRVVLNVIQRHGGSVAALLPPPHRDRR